MASAPIPQKQCREIHHYIPACIESIRGLASRGLKRIRGLASRGLKRIKVRLKAMKCCRGAKGIIVDYKGRERLKMHPNVWNCARKNT